MFSLVVIISAAVLVAAQSGYKPKIGRIALFYKDDGIPYLDCGASSDYGNYTLTLKHDHGNMRKSGSFPANEHGLDTLTIAINETGKYTCTAINYNGISTASVRFTDDLNIFNDENRLLQLDFRVFHATMLNPPVYRAYLYANNQGIPHLVKCFRDNEPLHLTVHQFMYAHLHPVSGTYSCLDDEGHVYGFEVRFGDE